MIIILIFHTLSKKTIFLYFKSDSLRKSVYRDASFGPPVPIDLRVYNKFPSWRARFFNILYHEHYKKYSTSKPLKVPECCTLAMHSTMDTGRDVRWWFEQRVVQDPRGLLKGIAARCRRIFEFYIFNVVLQPSFDSFPT